MGKQKCSNSHGHMAKTVAKPIYYGKIPLKYLLLWNQKADGDWTWYMHVGPTKLAPMMVLD